MTIRKRIVLLLAVFAAMLGAGAVAATPAQAFANDCTYTRFCVWTNYYYNGAPAYYWTIPSGSGGYCVDFGGSLNDNVDSAVIKGGRSATLYEHAGCNGQTVAFLAQTQYGGPWALSCSDYVADNWACSWSLPGKLPSSAWLLKI